MNKVVMEKLVSYFITYLVCFLMLQVAVSPYVSPSQQKVLDQLAAEAEAYRLALLADNFRELALIAMMDGVLEVRWEDEIKKDVPKPKCMVSMFMSTKLCGTATLMYVKKNLIFIQKILKSTHIKQNNLHTFLYSENFIHAGLQVYNTLPGYLKHIQISTSSSFTRKLFY